MPRQTAFSTITILCVSLSLCVGCDTGTFMPPPPPELAGGSAPPSAPAKSPTQTQAVSTAIAGASPPSAASARAEIKGVELILSRPSTVERDKLAFILRAEAGRLKIVFRLEAADSSNPMTPSRMASTIQKASERHCLIVLEPIDSPEICDAIRKAQANGTVIITLDASPVCPGLSHPIASIGFKGFADRGKELLATILSEAATRSFTANRPIVILENGASYSYKNDRLASLVDALTEKKLRFDRVPFSGDHTQAGIALENYLKSHPTPRIVLADDHDGLAAGIKALEKVQRDKVSPFLLGGYAIYDIRSGFAMIEDFPAIVTQSVESYSSAVARMVRDFATRKPVRDHVDIDLVLLRVVPEPRTPAGPPVIAPRSRDSRPGGRGASGNGPTGR